MKEAKDCKGFDIDIDKLLNNLKGGIKYDRERQRKLIADNIDIVDKYMMDADYGKRSALTILEEIWKIRGEIIGKEAIVNHLENNGVSLGNYLEYSDESDCGNELP